MDNNIINILKQSAEKIEVQPSKEVDTKIRAMIYKEEPVLYSKFNIILKPAVIVGFVFFVIFIFVKNIFYPSYIYSNIMNTIIDAQIAKDVDKALSLYSDDFFSINTKESLKNNIKALFVNYEKINYIPQKYRVLLKKNKILIENNVHYEAYPYDKKETPIKFKGRERIYLKKERDNWKIVAWLYED